MEMRFQMDKIPDSPRNMVTRLHPRALNSLSVSFYDSQGYDGRIRTRLFRLTF
jgi:hypothetical protein